MLLMSVWLGWTLLIWARHVRGIEAALGGAGAAGMPPVRGRASASWTRSSMP